MRNELKYVLAIVTATAVYALSVDEAAAQRRGGGGGGGSSFSSGGGGSRSFSSGGGGSRSFSSGGGSSRSFSSGGGGSRSFSSGGGGSRSFSSGGGGSRSFSSGGGSSRSFSSNGGGTSRSFSSNSGSSRSISSNNGNRGPNLGNRGPLAGNNGQNVGNRGPLAGNRGQNQGNRGPLAGNNGQNQNGRNNQPGQGQNANNGQNQGNRGPLAGNNGQNQNGRNNQPGQGQNANNGQNQGNRGPLAGNNGQNQNANRGTLSPNERSGLGAGGLRSQGGNGGFRNVPSRHTVAATNVKLGRIAPPQNVVPRISLTKAPVSIAATRFRPFLQRHWRRAFFWVAIPTIGYLTVPEHAYERFYSFLSKPEPDYDGCLKYLAQVAVEEEGTQVVRVAQPATVAVKHTIAVAPEQTFDARFAPFVNRQWSQPFVAVSMPRIGNITCPTAIADQVKELMSTNPAQTDKALALLEEAAAADTVVEEGALNDATVESVQ